MIDKDEAILIYQNNNADKPGFAWRFRERLVYPFQKKRFYAQWENAPMDMRFRLTNKCDENCARCFECSGPNNPLNTVPVDDVIFYGNQRDSNFTNIYMTGGEWSLIYDVQPHFMRKIFDRLDLSKSDEYTIQTNARWVHGQHRDEILDDIKHIQSAIGKHNGILKLDMSVDRYRSNKCIDAVRDVVLAVASDPQFKYTKIRLMSCALDAQMANERVLVPEIFKANGIKLEFQPRSWFNPYFQVCYANNTRIVIHEEGPTMRIGRAKQNNIGYKIYYPQLQCGGLQPEHTLMELSLREDGMIKWHNWYDWDIMVPYKDADGQYKSLPQIRAELVDMVWPRLLRHNIKNTILNLLPVYGLFRQIYINKQMQKTYEENRRQFIHHAVPIKEL
ncbi:MAG: hypothetical protein IKL37_05655 [Alphaproteobacteria bacterium]|nr:hypothetical protein [Alphaproteobacteria bacterium]